MSQSVFVLLHMRYRPSVIFPVAFRELLFCFVSNEVELASLPSPMIVYWQIWLEFPLNCQDNVQGHQRRFLLNALKSLFRLSRVLLDLYKCVLSSAIKFVSVPSSVGNLRLFEITSQGFSVIFPTILDAIERFTKVRIFLIPLSITFLNPKILGFLFLRKVA